MGFGSVGVERNRDGDSPRLLIPSDAGRAFCSRPPPGRNFSSVRASGDLQLVARGRDGLNGGQGLSIANGARLVTGTLPAVRNIRTRQARALSGQS